MLPGSGGMSTKDVRLGISDAAEKLVEVVEGFR